MEGGRLNVLVPTPTYRLPPPAICKEDIPYDALEDFIVDRRALVSLEVSDPINVPVDLPAESRQAPGSESGPSLEHVKRRYKEETELYRGAPTTIFTVGSPPIERASVHVYPRPGQVRFGTGPDSEVAIRQWQLMMEEEEAAK